MKRYFCGFFFVHLTRTPFQGRCMIATNHIYAGQTILTEKPLVCSQFLWNAAYGYSACAFCLTPLEDAQENVRRLAADATLTLPYLAECCVTDKSKHTGCVYGCTERYCSVQCRDDASKLFHQTLCSSFPSNAHLKPIIDQICEFWKSIHYPPETCSIMLLVKLLALVVQSPDANNIVQELNNFVHQIASNSQEFVHKMLGKCHPRLFECLVNQVFHPLQGTSLQNICTFCEN